MKVDLKWWKILMGLIQESAIQLVDEWLYWKGNVKIIIALPTKDEHVEIFKETIIGGFICVNTN